MTENYYQTKATVEEYIRLAKDIDGDALIKKLKKFLPGHATVLEVGSGPGTDWNLLRTDYDVVGSDNSPEFLSHLRSTYPEGKFIELDAITLLTDQKFEGIYSNKVLHHLKDNEFRTSIQRQFAVLTPEGIICHSFWKGEGSEIFKGLFVNFHTKASLQAFFEPAFDILLLEEYTEFEDGDSLLVIGKKKT